MRYHLRERLWSLTEDFVVRDDAGNPVFEIRGKFFHIGDNLVMYDRYSGQELVQIKQQILSLLPSYNIYRNGQHWAHVHEQIHLFGERFKIEGSNGMIFHVDGNLWNWDFNVVDNYGNLMGRISRQLSLFRDSYAVDVAPGVDAPFIVALAIVLEMVKEHKEQHERRD
ncbi:MAG TPA: LURP-one-related family protein [Ktedonobacteraceae bacterium]|nr:LURP-one-related family protein [Ktedonobacteraceae bacterium]